MKKLTFFSITILSLLFAASCEKDMLVDNSTALPNGAMLSTLKAQKEAAATQTFTVNGEEGGTVVGIQGTRVKIEPLSLYTGVNNQGNPIGDPIEGNVSVTLIEVYDLKDMVFMNKPTMGRFIANAAGDTLSTLISGGEYYLKVTYNGNPVYSPAGVAVYLPVENLGGANAMMEEFDGSVNSSGNIVWYPTDESVATVDVPTDSVGGQQGEFVTCYEIVGTKWGWKSVAYFYDAPGEQTIVKAKLPTGFDASNTELYISYDMSPGTLAAIDISSGSEFTEKFGLIPVGLPVHFVAVTYLDGQLHYAIQSSTIEEDHVETITKFKPTTQSELSTLITTLP